MLWASPAIHPRSLPGRFRTAHLRLRVRWTLLQSRIAVCSSWGTRSPESKSCLPPQTEYCPVRPASSLVPVIRSRRGSVGGGSGRVRGIGQAGRRLTVPASIPKPSSFVRTHAVVRLPLSRLAVASVAAEDDEPEGDPHGTVERIAGEFAGTSWPASGRAARRSNGTRAARRMPRDIDKRGVRGGSRRLRVTALVPMGFHERPHVVRTIPCAILVWILRDHLGQIRTDRRFTSATPVDDLALSRSRQAGADVPADRRARGLASRPRGIRPVSSRRCTGATRHHGQRRSRPSRWRGSLRAMSGTAGR